MPRQVAAPFSEKLLSWYRQHGRKGLPWRRKRDPYAVWVSEAMLQQTQVETAIPYYRRFLRKFPTLRALSRAPLTEVLESWSGLGYYSRAKNLHAGAQKVEREYGGKIPSDPEELRRIPGIGRYTAGAVASIAFDRPAPILDGNVQRVLSRYFGIRGQIREVSVQRRLWELAERLVPAESPGAFNQAMMDLGATVCTRHRPRCPVCPIRLGCLARKRGWQEEIPLPRPAAARKKIRYLCGLIERDGQLLLARRPTTGLLPGLWEFPGGEAAGNGKEPATLARLLADRLGLKVKPSGPPRSHRQLLTHRELRIRAYPCRLLGGRLRPRWYTDLRWVAKRELAGMAFTAGMRRLAESEERR